MFYGVLYFLNPHLSFYLPSSRPCLTHCFYDRISVARNYYFPFFPLSLALLSSVTCRGPINCGQFYDIIIIPWSGRNSTPLDCILLLCGAAQCLSLLLRKRAIEGTSTGHRAKTGGKKTQGDVTVLSVITRYTYGTNTS